MKGGSVLPANPRATSPALDTAVPIALMAKSLYPWMTSNPAEDHALASKLPLLTMPMFYAIAALCFISWTVIAFGLRGASLRGALLSRLGFPRKRRRSFHASSRSITLLRADASARPSAR